MADRPLVRSVASGIVAADHPQFEEVPVLVGPSTSDQFNTIRPRLIPKACWKLEDGHFEFDSSFITPFQSFNTAALKALIEEHPGAKLSVFGHADPVGNDVYNKTLSGRRAQAVYALLTRRTDLWEELFSVPSGNDRWGARALEVMLDFVEPAPAGGGGNGRPPAPGRRDDALQIERDPGRRRALFLRYMDKLCVDDAGVPFKLLATDFLAEGRGRDLKGDIQGCGEFNPLLIFSRRKTDELNQPARKARRDLLNAPNRRVLVLLFRAGSRVESERWPCPTVKEGIAGCQKRLFSDAATRRAPGAEDREYQKTKNTFACRFYDRFVNSSPCEEAMRFWVIRLLEDGPEPLDKRLPMANQPFSVTGVGAGVPELRGTTDSRGVLRIAVKDDPTVMKLVVAGHEITVFAGSLKPVSEGTEGVAQRLRNMGFGLLPASLVATAEAIAGLDRFRELHALPAETALSAADRSKLEDFHGG